MKSNTTLILRLIAGGAILLLVMMAMFINSSLASLVELFLPGSNIWVNLILLSIEVLAFLWFWRGLFGRHKHLLLLDNATEEERERFKAELSLRMRKNTIIMQLQEQGQIDANAADYLEQCLKALGVKADEEIRKNSQRIFLATALSQNGRLDALIVFVSLCRLVWRISGIYNQRPHPREIASLYLVVVSSTFLAFSLEELDITTEIGIGFSESFQASAPAGATASIPFAGKALQTFTHAAIDGTANCYLALRAGIVTRNAYAYGANPAGRPGRGAVFKEAGAILLSMSGSLMEKLAAAVAGGFVNMARYAQHKTTGAGREIAGGIGKAYDGIADSAGKIASGTVNVVQSTGNGIKKAGIYTGEGIGKVATGTWHIATLPVRKTSKEIGRFIRKTKKRISKKNA